MTIDTTLKPIETPMDDSVIEVLDDASWSTRRPRTDSDVLPDGESSALSRIWH